MNPSNANGNATTATTRRAFGLPDPLSESKELAARVDAWRRDMAPEGPHAEWLARLAAVSSLRLERADAFESALIAHEATRARLAWDDDRRLDAEVLGDRLTRSQNPALVRRKLERTLHGADWLADRWRGLAEIADSGAGWSAARRGLALALLGVAPESSEEGDERVSIPQALPATASLQADFARSEVARLDALRDGKLRTLDDEERAIACQGLSLTESPARARLRREQARWTRDFYWAMSGLARARREPAKPEPPAPPADRPRPAPHLPLDVDGPDLMSAPDEAVECQPRAGAAGRNDDDVARPGRVGTGAATRPRGVPLTSAFLPPGGLNRAQRRRLKAL